MSDEARFPILPAWDHPRLLTDVPWSLIAPHEAQAKQNHGGQSLVELARRGGLSECELIAVLEDRKWHPMDWRTATAQTQAVLAAARAALESKP